MIVANPRGVPKLRANLLQKVAQIITTDYFNYRSTATKGRFKSLVLRFRHPYKPWLDVRLPVLWTFTHFRTSTKDIDKILSRSNLEKYNDPYEEDLFLRWQQYDWGHWYPSLVQTAYFGVNKTPSLGDMLYDGSRAAVILGIDRPPITRVFPNLSSSFRNYGNVPGQRRLLMSVVFWLARPFKNESFPHVGFDRKSVYAQVLATLSHEITHALDRIGRLTVAQEGRVDVVEDYAVSKSEQRARSTELWFWLLANKDRLLKEAEYFRDTQQERASYFIDKALTDFYYNTPYHSIEWKNLPEEEKRNKLRIIARFWESIEHELGQKPERVLPLPPFSQPEAKRSAFLEIEE